MTGLPIQHDYIEDEIITSKAITETLEIKQNDFNSRAFKELGLGRGDKIKLEGGQAEVAQAFRIGPSLIRFPSSSSMNSNQKLDTEPRSKRYYPNLSVEYDNPSSPLQIPRRPSLPTDSIGSSPSSYSSSSTIAPHKSPAPSSRTIRPSLSNSKRPNSTIYESFPHRPPATPFDASEIKEAGWFDWIGLGSQTHAVGFIQSPEGKSVDLESGTLESRLQEEQPLLGCRKREGLPKVTRECLISEFKCYGKHMLPPILFFVFFVLGVGLFVYSKARENHQGP